MYFGLASSTKSKAILYCNTRIAELTQKRNSAKYLSELTDCDAQIKAYKDLKHFLQIMMK